MTPIRTTTPQRPIFAFLVAIPIAILGGLIGLGGAEFRLPILVGPLFHRAKTAISLNIAVSLVTVITSLFIRAERMGTLNLPSLGVPIGALITGAIISAYFSAAYTHHLSEKRLEQIIVGLLIIIGIALIAESFLPQAGAGFVPAIPVWQAFSGFLFGLGIGTVSSLLGVAGGELIIPTLIFAFGADIKSAGTASLLVSLPMVAIGVWRHLRLGNYKDRNLIDWWYRDSYECRLGHRRSIGRDCPCLASKVVTGRNFNFLCHANVPCAPSSLNWIQQP